MFKCSNDLLTIPPLVRLVCGVFASQTSAAAAAAAATGVGTGTSFQSTAWSYRQITIKAGKTGLMLIGLRKDKKESSPPPPQRPHSANPENVASCQYVIASFCCKHIIERACHLGK